MLVDDAVEGLVRLCMRLFLKFLLCDVAAKPLGIGRFDLIILDFSRTDTVLFDEFRDGDPFALAERLAHLHRGKGVVHGAVRDELHPERFGNDAEPDLTVEAVLGIHPEELRVVPIEAEGRELVPLGLEVEIVDVVEGRVAQNDGVPIFEKMLDLAVGRGEGRIFFEVLVFVGEHDALLALAVGEAEFAARIYEDVVLFEQSKIRVRDDVPERTHLCNIFEYARAFDIEKNVLHRDKISSNISCFERFVLG